MATIEWNRPGGRRAAVEAVGEGGALPAPPMEVRAIVARQALAAYGSQRLLDAAAGWEAPTPASLPGLFHALAKEHPHVVRLPGAGLLAALTEAPPWRPRFANHGARIDGFDWPVRRDAELALWVALRDGAAEVAASPAARWLAGEPVEPGELDVAVRIARARWLATSCADLAELRTLLDVMVDGDIPPRTDEGLSALLAEVAREDPRALRIAHWIAFAAHTAVQGWLAFDAHRSLPSSTAKAAAEVLAEAGLDAGGEPWRALVLKTIDLVADDQRRDGALLVEADAHDVAFIVRPGDQLVIGRMGDVRVDHDTVGRRHAQLDYRSGVCLLSDATSPCGTYHNDQQVNGEQALAPGDRIGLGRVALTVRALRGDS